ncbi:MAG: hypothetical protein VXY28_01500 [Bacteroidota bacterium]|nr:hypothetical protein [Bacteroidota bacterium]
MTNVNIIMNVDNDAFMHENLGSDIAKILKNYANVIEFVVDPDTTFELQTKLTDINGETIGKVTLITGGHG